MSNLISVLMPVYNVKSNELKTSIESILSQTYDNFEFIIINDGSTNDVEDIILSYKDKRIKYYKNDSNLKLIATLNKGLDLCKGKYIARLDADDYSNKDRLEKQYSFMENNPEIGLCGTLFKIFSEEKTFEVNTNVNDIPLCIRYIPGCLLHSSAMMRTSVLRENNIYYNKGCIHAEDFKMWSDLSRVSKVAVIPEILTYYRASADGICANNKKWQNKMLQIIAIENIIQDYSSDKETMYSILVKYAKGTNIKKDEYKILCSLLENFIKDLSPQLSDEYKYKIIEYSKSILRHCNMESKIIWMKN